MQDPQTPPGTDTSTATPATDLPGQPDTSTGAVPNAGEASTPNTEGNTTPPPEAPGSQAASAD